MSVELVLVGFTDLSIYLPSPDPDGGFTPLEKKCMHSSVLE